jgi:D-glycero-D-manno-heptose 1,7-bisphosphate phosphatase
MKAVFLDRDGTIVVEKGYITVADDIELIPGAADAIIRLRAAGWKIYVATNQGSVGKGMITEEELSAINFRMLSMLGAEGAELDGIYVCPHHPNGSVPEYTMECECRKPRPGLLERAASENDLDLSQCVMIGDTIRDLEAGRSAGARAILVLTGHGPDTAALDHGAEHVAADLAAAVQWLLDGTPK